MSSDATDWVGQRAVAWVIDDAPVPADLAFTLIVIARRCDEDGRGSYQSMKTLAEKTGKSEDQARRDVKRLRDLELILLGDQSIPEKHGIPAGKRPAVYDLPLDLKGPKPLRRSKNESGLKKDTPGMDATPGIHAPPASMQPLASMQGGPLASMPLDPLHACKPNKTLNNPENKTEETAHSPSETARQNGKPAKRRAKERTPEEQARFDLADKLAHGWWDIQCPTRGIPVISKGNRSAKAGFPGFRQMLESALKADCTPEEIKQALVDCGTAWPALTALTNAVATRRGRNPRNGTRPTNQHIESAAGDQLAEVFG